MLTYETADKNEADMLRPLLDTCVLFEKDEFDSKTGTYVFYFDAPPYREGCQTLIDSGYENIVDMVEGEDDVWVRGGWEEDSWLTRRGS